MQPPSNNPPSHHRRSIRLKGYDYTLAGAYFVTLVTHGRENWFGEVVGGEMRLNHIGQSAAACWEEIPAHFVDVELDAFVIMPNHVHGILVIKDNNVVVGATHASPLPNGPKPRSIGTILGSFKSAVTRRINTLRGTPGQPLWQRNYYEHIIRSADDWSRIHAYIQANPAQWENDREFNPGT